MIRIICLKQVFKYYDNMIEVLKNKKHIAIIFLIAITTYGCSVFQQTSEIANFGRCEFRLESVDKLNLGGVSIQGKNSMSDLGIMEYARITSAVAKGSLPLTFNLNVAAKNPNSGTAAMNKLEWILYIDKVEMTRGVLNQRVEIPAQNISTFPVSMNFDLMKSLSGESGEALLNLAFNLSGSSDKPSQVMLKAKPTIMIGSTPIEYPGYINIKQEFGSQ